MLPENRSSTASTGAEVVSGREREWYQRPWGVVVAILFFPVFLVWYAWARSTWSTPVKVSLTAAMVLLVYFYEVGRQASPH